MPNVELDCWKLRDIVSDLYLAMLKQDSRELVILQEGDLMRAAATLNCILDECRQARQIKPVEGARHLEAAE